MLECYLGPGRRLTCGRTVRRIPCFCYVFTIKSPHRHTIPDGQGGAQPMAMGSFGVGRGASRGVDLCSNATWDRGAASWPPHPWVDGGRCAARPQYSMEYSRIVARILPCTAKNLLIPRNILECHFKNKATYSKRNSRIIDLGQSVKHE